VTAVLVPAACCAFEREREKRERREREEGVRERERERERKVGPCCVFEKDIWSHSYV